MVAAQQVYRKKPQLSDEKSQQMSYLWSTDSEKAAVCKKETQKGMCRVEMTGLLIRFYASPTNTHKETQAHHSYRLSCIVS